MAGLVLDHGDDPVEFHDWQLIRPSPKRAQLVAWWHSKVVSTS